MGSLKFGLARATKSFFGSKSPFTALNKKSHFGEDNEEYEEENGFETDESVDNYTLTFLLLFVITGILLGFMAVPRLCKDTSERGKNVRLGLYFLLILTGGQFGWFFGLLWLFKINICA